MSEALESLSYKPGWWFELVDRDTVRIHWVTANSMPGADGDIELHVDCDVAGMATREALLAIERRIEGIEAHERAEWLRWYGLCVSAEARRSHPGLYEPIDYDAI